MKDTSFLVSDAFKQRWGKDHNGTKFCNFLSFKGKDLTNDKTLIELLHDPKLPDMQKQLLQEYVSFGEESNQDIDKDIRHNYGSFIDLNLTKCETVVQETMRYSNGEFDGEDSHAKAGPGLFWADIAHSIPKGKESQESVIFYMSKFLSWFDSCGFGKGNQRTLFLKRLRTIKNMYASSDPAVRLQAEDMLWYAINGIIIDENSSGKDTPPHEFTDGLNAFKKFFKENMDTVLSDSVVSATMGDSYAKDSDAQKAYALGNRSEYVSVVTNRATSLIGVDRDKNKKIQEKYRLDDYIIYDDFYKLAERLQDRHSIQNVFRKYNSSSAQLAETDNNQSSKRQARASNTGVAINNTDTLSQLTTNLNTSSSHKRSSQQEDEDDFIAANEDMF